jgi:hypothetical protein
LGHGIVRSNDVKYMLLIYSNPANAEALSEEERNTQMGEADAIIEELIESGEWIGGEALADPRHAKTVRVRGGLLAITDGPFVEAAAIDGPCRRQPALGRKPAYESVAGGGAGGGSFVVAT